MMDSSMQKGCLIGCLSSVLLVVLVCLVSSYLVGMAFSGSIGNGNEANVGQREDFRVVYEEGNKDGVEVVHLKLRGVIRESREPRGLFGNGDYDSAAAALQKLRFATKKKSIKGVWLDIDSPGGTVTMSDMLNDALYRFRAAVSNRFVVVQMGSMCCSGGYYIAAAADEIVARPTTLTGSIGVIMSGMNMHGLAQKIGVDSVVIASGKNKAMLDPFKPVDTNQVALLRTTVDAMYSRFLDVVAKGRKMPVDVLKPLADGRIFSAEDALKNRLVDSIGYEEDVKDNLAKRVAPKPLKLVKLREERKFEDLFEGALLFQSAASVVEEMRSVAEESATAKVLYMTEGL